MDRKKSISAKELRRQARLECKREMRSALRQSMLLNRDRVMIHGDTADRLNKYRVWGSDN